MRLSPRDPRLGQWRNFTADAELGLGHYDGAIEQASMAIDAGYRTYFAYLNLAAAHAFKGEMDEAKTAMAEARRLYPKLSVKWLSERKPILPARVRSPAQGGAAGRMSETRQLAAILADVVGYPDSWARTRRGRRLASASIPRRNSTRRPPLPTSLRVALEMRVTLSRAKRPAPPKCQPASPSPRRCPACRQIRESRPRGPLLQPLSRRPRARSCRRSRRPAPCSQEAPTRP